MTFPLMSQEFCDLWPMPDLVVDGGRIAVEGTPELSRTGSTVIDLSSAVKSQCQRLHYRIIRDGRFVMCLFGH